MNHCASDCWITRKPTKPFGHHVSPLPVLIARPLGLCSITTMRVFHGPWVYTIILHEPWICIIITMWVCPSVLGQLVQLLVMGRAYYCQLLTNYFDPNDSNTIPQTETDPHTTILTISFMDTHAKLHPQKWVSSFCLFVWFDSLRPINNLSVKQGRVFLGWTSNKLR